MEAAMTIKRRLLLSNILMILVPAAATALIGAISIHLIWGMLSASPETIHHYGSYGGMHHGMSHGLFDDRHFFFGPRESMALIGLILVITITVSILLTNRFLTRFVFRHIKQPLDVLSDGVMQIGQGQLDHRIVYEENDEFSPVCDAFNDMADRLKASVEQTQKNEESRKLLLAGISHDLRSPLTSIRAYSEGLIDGVAVTEEDQRQYLNTIQRKADEIDRLVSQVFTYSKLDLKDDAERDENFDPSRETLSFLDAHGSEYASQGLQIYTQLLPGKARGEGELFRRILSNICENSLKYMRRPSGNLYISMQRLESHVLFVAADDGPGVADEDLPKLFDVLYRGDSARNDPAGGSGLGLSIVRRCVEQMGGSIHAEHAPGGGLAIVISLQIYEEEPQG